MTLLNLCRAMGLEVRTITAGDGKSYPKAGDRVLIEYTGRLIDGNYMEIGVNSLIRALDEGTMLISVGEKAVITATAEYGYGTRGFPPVIPANATLRLEEPFYEAQHFCPWDATYEDDCKRLLRPDPDQDLDRDFGHHGKRMTEPSPETDNDSNRAPNRIEIYTTVLNVHGLAGCMTAELPDIDLAIG
ncbi:hypothetical protein BS47DRAFT_1393002 [Hydnum rufescens UP504]|uniref:peptidylprolyl isomerase n=1 Tax=Hydnum rufescens UP504 TaxID=1448309 RepID=A0A9P6AXU6_9AGAM|nr:hypothetical protein BS47DRAFT_1393002 [Hydnum rufescens UP504]